MPVLLAHAIEDSTDIFGISGGGGLNPPLGTPLVSAVLLCSSIKGLNKKCDDIAGLTV